MKTLGLIGGVGWESTALYYRLINEEVRNRFGSLHSAPMIVNSLEFQTLDAQVKANRWNDADASLAEAARTLERAGAEALLLCSNQMHYVFEAVGAGGSGRRLPVTVLLPDPADFAALDHIIYGELCRGLVREESRALVLRVVRNLRAHGAQGIVLASSELALLLRADDFALPLLDSTELHALAEVRWALETNLTSARKMRPDATHPPSRPKPHLR
jgi:aspartate racemase